MATPKAKEVKVHGNDRWMVDWGVADDGKRRREFYESAKEANDAVDAYLKEKKRCGEFWVRMPGPERKAVVSVLEEIKAEKLTPRQVWEDFKRWRVSKPVIESVTFAKAVEVFKARKLAAGLDERYVEDACDLFLRFGAGREQKLISNITPDELELWINEQKWGKSTKKANMGRFASLWTVAVDEKGWASVNIVDRLQKVGKLGRTAQIFANEVCLALLAATQANTIHQKATAPIALGLLCGMRPEEVSHEDWGWDFIALNGVEIHPL